MTVLDGRWAKFKQELLPILYVSIIQVWWFFKFPPTFMQVATPWNTVLMIIQSIIGISCTIFVFSFADNRLVLFNLAHLDAFPHAQVLKKIQRTIFIAAIVIGALLAWYKDFYGMSNLAYLLLYSFWIITFILLYRAAYRVPSE